MLYFIPNYHCCCESGGLAWIGAKRRWVLTCALSDMGKECGHNVCMDHANVNGFTYGDPFDIMTRGFPDTAVHELNALHRLQLNWIPQARVADVTSSRTFTVGALERDGLTVPQILRIRRSNAVDDYIYV